MQTSRCISFFIFCTLATLLITGAMAQTTSGTITGIVTDQSGAIVPGAKIILIDEATKEQRETVASDSGEFVFAALRPSTYSMSVEKPGFQGFRQNDLVLTQNARLALGNIRMTVGQSTESVTITAQAPAINTEGADT